MELEGLEAWSPVPPPSPHPSLPVKTQTTRPRRQLVGVRLEQVHANSSDAHR